MGTALLDNPRKSGGQFQFFALFVHLLLPTLDFLTDVFYVLTTDYYHIALFVVMLAFICIPMFLLVRRLVKNQAPPRFGLWPRRLLWLAVARYDYKGVEGIHDGVFTVFAPHCHLDLLSEPIPRLLAYIYRHLKDDNQQSKPKKAVVEPAVLAETTMRPTLLEDKKFLLPLAATEHIVLPKAILNPILWLLYLVAQIAYVPLVMACLLVECVFLAMWFLVGCVLLWVKVDCLTIIWNIWFRVWTKSYDFDAMFEDGDHYEIDTDVLNGIMLNHFLFESSCHLVLQSFNNVLLDKPWTYTALLSLACSCVQVFGGVYSFSVRKVCSCLGVRTAKRKDMPQVLAAFGILCFNIPPAKKIVRHRLLRKQEQAMEQEISEFAAAKLDVNYSL